MPLLGSSRPSLDRERSYARAGQIWPWLAAAFVAATFVCGGILVYETNRREFRAQVLSQLENVAELKVRQVQDWRQERINDAGFLVRTPAVAESVYELLRHPGSSEAAAAVRGWLRNFHAPKRYETIIVLDQNQQVCLRMPDEAAPPGEGLRGALPALLRAPGVKLLDLPRPSSDGPGYLDVVASIPWPTPTSASHDPDGPAMATIVMRVNPRIAFYPLIQQWPAVTDTAEAILLRVEGQTAEYLSERRFHPETELSSRRRLIDTVISGADGHFGISPAREAVDYRGVSVFAAARPVPDVPWYVAAKIDVSEALAPLHREAWRIAGFTALLVVGVFLAAFALVRALENRLLFRALAAEARYRSLFEASEACMLIVDPANGAILDANPAAVRFYGWSYPELTRMNAGDLNTSSRELLRQRMDEAVSVGSFNAVMQHRTADERLRDVHVYSSPISLRDRVVLFSIVHDVTDRRAAEEALRLRVAALEAAANAIVITDRRGRIEWANRAVTELNGFTLEETIGRTLTEIVATNTQNADAKGRIWEAVLAGELWRGEIVNEGPDGSPRTFDMTVTPLRGADGQVTHFIAIKNDVTERRKLEAQLQQAQRLEAIGTLAGGVAHDLNNILAPIILVAGMLQERVDGRDRELLSMALESAQRGAQVVKQLLQFSRGSVGERLALDLRPLLKEMQVIIRETFPRNIEVRSEIGAPLWATKANPSQIHQVLLNLAVNARDAMERGGVLTMGASNVELVRNDARLPADQAPGRYVLVETRDTGHGIAADMLPRIFDPFFTTKPLGKGTGLGLSTVLGIVKAHGGFIAVDSTPHEGTAFRVYLPATSADSAVAATPEAAVDVAGGATVLIVDDEPMILRALELGLQAAKYSVRTAGDALEALRVFLKHRAEISIVITDIMMPGLGGVGLVRALRELSPDLQIVVLSGYSDEAQESELRALRVPILTKPIDLAALVARLQPPRVAAAEAMPRLAPAPRHR